MSARVQSIHTYILGAEAFGEDTLTAIGEQAVQFLDAAWPDALSLGRWFDLPPALAADLLPRARGKLVRRAIDDLRLDFEDGYGGAAIDEVADAIRCGRLLAVHARRGEQPASLGLRVRPLAKETAARALAVLDAFVGAFVAAGGAVAAGRLVVNLAKAEAIEQVTALASALTRLERGHQLAPGTLGVELMAETPRAIYAQDGRLAAPALVAQLHGRRRRVCFGVYDFTAACGVAAGLQGLRHPLCDAARAALLLGLAGAGDVELADGSSQVVPVLPPPSVAVAAGGGDGIGGAHPGSPPVTLEEAERRARSIYADVRHSLAHAYYTGWDLHPAQVAIRHLAVFAFFREQLPAMAVRMRRALERGGVPSLAGGALEDAATGEALLGFFRRGHACEALDDDDLAVAGLAVKELASPDWPTLLARRRSVKE